MALTNRMSIVRVRLETLLHDSIFATRLLNYNEAEAVAVLDYVYNKPIGDFDNEIADLWIAYGALMYSADVTADLGDEVFVRQAGRWVYKVFGTELTKNTKERCFRFTEELFECLQAAAISKGTVRRVIAEAYAKDLRYRSLKAHQTVHLQHVGRKLKLCSSLTKTDYLALRDDKLAGNQKLNAMIVEKWTRKPETVRVKY